MADTTFAFTNDQLNYMGAELERNYDFYTKDEIKMIIKKGINGKYHNGSGFYGINLVVLNEWMKKGRSDVIKKRNEDYIKNAPMVNGCKVSDEQFLPNFSRQSNPDKFNEMLDQWWEVKESYDEEYNKSIPAKKIPFEITYPR